MSPFYCTVWCLYRCVAIILLSMLFLVTLLYLCGCGVPILYSHVLRFLVVTWLLSIGSLVDPNMCLFIMGLSAQSVVWGCGVCAANVEYAFFRQLWVCYFVAPSLMRGRVCNLLLLLVLSSAVPRDSRPYFIVPILETPPTWRSRSPYLYPPGTRWPRYSPRHWVPFLSPLTTCRTTVEVFYPSSTREWALYSFKILF
jgi:hypothetical protein